MPWPVTVLLVLLVLFVVLPYFWGMALKDETVGVLHVVLPVPPERVWDELQQGERHPVSGAMARSIRTLEGGPGAWEEDLGNTRVTVRTVVAEAPRRCVREMQDAVVPMTARWTLELEPHEEGTFVRAENRTVVRSGSWRSPIFRLILRASGGSQKVLREYFRSIAGALGVTARAQS